MLSTHLYPAPADPHPTFMLGHFDLDEEDPVSLADFGEAMLRVRKTDRGLIRTIPSHHQSGPACRGTESLLFGLLAEQPLNTLPDDLILNLWATEQA